MSDVYHATALAQLAPFLLHGKTDGLTEAELAAANKLLAEFDDLEGPYLVDVERDDDGNAVEPQYGRCEYTGVRGQVINYRILHTEGTAKPGAPASHVTPTTIVDFKTREIGMAIGRDDSIVHLDLRPGTLIEPRRLDRRLAEALRDCAAPENHNPYDNIAAVRRMFRIEGDPDAIRRTVEQWFAGAILTDLDDEDENLNRIIWLIAGSVRERRPFAID